jgi:hypothetical protein
MRRSFLRFIVQLSVVLCLFTFMDSRAAFGQGTNPFVVPPTFSGNGQKFAADVNGDGKTDLVFSDGTVLLGKGDGTFTTGTSWNPTGSTTVSLSAVADFNGDGKQDLLLAGPLNQLSVLLGNGDGTFQAAVTTSISMPSSALLVGDLNGDGKADVLAQVGTNFSTFLSNGDGTFAAAINSNAAGALGAFADFNGDGKLDLLVSGQGIQLGNGDGTFQALLPFPTGALPGGFIGDFDGDARLDVLAFGGTSTSPQIQVLFGNGDGTFHAGTVQSLAASVALSNLVAVDLNGDGKADLVGSGGDAVQALIGKGDGTFVPGTVYNAPQGASPTGSTNVVIADFNGDNKKDVAAFNTMLLGNGDGTLQGDEAVPGLAGINGVTGDFNGDGNPDLAFFTVTGQTSATVKVWLNDGKANFTLANSYQIAVPPNGNFGAFANVMAAVDVNGDGKIDLVGYFAGGSEFSVFVMLGNGDGSFGSPITSPVEPGIPNDPTVSSFVVADLNGDGKPDLLFFANAAAGFTSFNVMLGNGDGTFAAPTNPYVGNPGTGGVILTGDFNNDHKVDAIVGGASGISILLGNGDGTFQPTTFITSSACGTSCSGLAAADLNGDGNLDLIANSPGGYQVLLGKGDGTFTQLTGVGATVGTMARIADFNGDGKLDVLGNFPTSLMLGNGDGTLSAPFQLLPAMVSGPSLVADFSGNTRPDVAVLTATQLVWFFNSQAAVTPPPPPAPPDFSVGSGSGGGTATVVAGGTATYSLSLAGSGGFTGNVALTCSVAPAGPACSVSPSSVMVSGSAAATATVSVTTTARSGLLPIGGSNERDSSRKILWMFGAFMVAAGVICLYAGTQARPRRFSWSLATACGAILLLSASLGGGCGGGANSSSGSGASTATGTSAGSYTVTVAAQSGSVVHKAQLTLTVR